MGEQVGREKDLNLTAFVPRFLRQRLALNPSAARPRAEQLSAAVMIADLSGFSALAERFARRGTRGAEELKDLLNLFFGSLVDEVHAHGGHILKFPGDAALALWPASGGDVLAAARSAGRCGLAAHDGLLNVRTADGRQLELRVGIGVGPVWTATVGGVSSRWELLIAGEGLTDALHSVSAAKPGEVIGSPALWDLIARFATGSGLADGHVKLESVDPPATTARDVRLIDDCAESQLREYVPRSVQARLDAGQTDWLAEFRRVTVLFASIATIDYTSGDPTGPLQQAFTAVQTAVYRYGGSVNQLLVDEKGTVAACGWGLALHAHGDDEMRAVRAALDISAALRALGLSASCGIATGEVFTGLRGNRARCEYAMIGDTVNRAARLMQVADGQILCDALSFERTSDRIAFDALSPVNVKGLDSPLRVYRPTQVLAGGRSQIVGRVEERLFLRTRFDALLGGRRAGTMILEGDAGIGKSRLVADLIDAAVSHGVRTLLAAGDEIDRSTPYYVWRPLFDNLLGLRRSAAAADDSRRVLDDLEADARLLPFAALLNPVLALNLPATEASERVPPRGGAILTRDLLLHLFRRSTGGQPTLLVLEDAHWFDSSSWALAEAVARGVPGVLALIVLRPLSPGQKPPELVRLSATEGTLLVRLDGLSLDETKALVCQKLRVRELNEPLLRVIHDKAGGHPFFTEELVHSLHDGGLIEIDRGICRFAGNAAGQSFQIPDTVQVVVTSRIDQLTVAEQLTVKVASVLGATFDIAALQAAYPIEVSAAILQNHVDGLIDRDLVRLSSSEPGATYMFKHAITQEVAYSLLPFEQRRQLHARVAGWYEQRYSQDLSAFYPLLAHHWSRADIADRAIFYLEKAGEQAVSRHANEEATRFYGEAIAIDRRVDTRSESGPPIRVGRQRFVSAHDAQRIRWHRRMGDALVSLGKWDEGRRQFELALALIGRPLPASPAALACGLGAQVLVQCARRIAPQQSGRSSPAAVELLREAVCAYGRVGANAYQYGRLVQVIYCLIASINLAERLGPTAEFAVACCDVGNILGLAPVRPLARTYHRLASQTAHQLDDPIVIARVNARASVFQLGIGNWREACADLDASMALCDQIGDSYVWEENAAIRSRAAQLTGDFEFATRLGAEIRRRAAGAGSLGHEIWGCDAEVWGTLSLGLHDAALDLAEHGLRLISTAERTEPISLLDLLAAKALAHVYRSELDRARESADRIFDLLTKSPRPRYFAVLYLSGVLETYLALWEAGPSKAASEARTRASRLYRTIEQYARISPPARARALLWRGCMDWLGGASGSAHTAWQRALGESERFSLPYETARVHYEIGRHLEAGDPERHQHARKAEEGFRRLKAAGELKRLVALGLEGRTRIPKI